MAEGRDGALSQWGDSHKKLYQEDIFGGWRDGLVVRTFPDLAKDSSLLPRIHIRWLTTAYNSGSGGSDAPFWPLGSHTNMTHNTHNKQTSQQDSIQLRHDGTGL